VNLLRFEIRYADGRKEVMVVDGDRALIGSGAHCDVRLPLDQSASEHVSVEIIGGTVRLETKAFEPPATVNGMPFTSMPITGDVPLKIGTSRIFISQGEGEGGPVVQKKAEQTSPLMKVLAIAALFAGAFVLMADDESTAPPAPAQAPDLFPPSSTTCPQVAPDQANSFASEKFDIAEGKRERSPFAPKDGLQAVQLYELARVCFKLAGNQARAQDADTAAQQLRASITQDFRARRVRLDHMLSVGDYELAKNDVKVLRSLTEAKGGQYSEWLARQAQFLKQKGTTK
jgi:hypothetical protein